MIACIEAVRGGNERNTDLGFRANTVLAIDPNVLGHAVALLFEIHVFHELESRSAMGKLQWKLRELRTHILRVGDGS